MDPSMKEPFWTWVKGENHSSSDLASSPQYLDVSAIDSACFSCDGVQVQQCDEVNC